MLLKYYISIILLVILFQESYSSVNYAKVIYTSPVNNAKLVNSFENIIFKTGKNLESERLVCIVKYFDGRLIEGNIKLASDKKTFIFDPVYPFKKGEQITADLISLKDNRLIKSISFTTSINILSESEKKKVISDIREKEFGQTQKQVYRIPEKPNGFNTGGVIMPQITITKNNNPSNGTLFFANIARDTLTSPFIMSMKNNGEFLFYREMPKTCYDFKVQNNGLITYFQNIAMKFYALDSAYTVVDSFATGNGYETDLHDILIKEDGNVLLMSYDVQVIDMSLVVPGGQKDANVTGLIIQEIDSDKNVIFQWRSWDHFQITDADRENLSLGNVDYCHGNAFDVDYDGNYVISSRNMSEITKINKETGAIIWRLGGKNNQFTFINDSIKFSYQHAIKRTAAGTFTLFDNGNYHKPSFSRSVEYRIDETNMTAEKVWEYRNEPSIYTFAMGYTERLKNGNTSISWGFAPTAYTEVNSNNEIVYEFNFDSTNFSYRIFREDWNVSPDGIPNIPVDFAVTLNYPNPFNAQTNIYFNVINNSNVTLKIYDILGKEVATLLNNEFKETGKYVSNFNSVALSSGIYFYKLQIGNDFYTHSMALVK